MGVTSFPYHIISRTLAPVKVSFFVWKASHGKILTIDNLQRRGFTLANRCYMCKGDSESANHLLFHRKAARALWEIAFNCLGVCGVAFDSIKNHVLEWEGVASDSDTNRTRNQKLNVTYIMNYIMSSLLISKKSNIAINICTMYLTNINK